MPPLAYYNEIDPYAAQWLRNLIDAGHIAPGIVDERSIEDVLPSDLRGFTQCHFFAGIGVWSYALRRAGWPDDRPVWTGSCPCQPFSAAGKGAGFDDERHLWPAFHHLIKECRPAIVFGEQVASKDADPWIDLVCNDLEALDYAVGAVPFPSAGVGAPHIRDRLYWVAYATDQRFDWGRPSSPRNGRDTARQQPERLCDAGELGDTERAGLALGQRLAGVLGRASGAIQREASERAGVHPGWLADSNGRECDGVAVMRRDERDGADAGRAEGVGGFAACGDTCGVADADGRNASAEREQCSGQQRQQPQDGGAVAFAAAGPVNGPWRSADWLLCRDGKWRPVEPGTQPLAHGSPNRVGRLRAYGNAINAEAARCFIESVVEAA